MGDRLLQFIPRGLPRLYVREIVRRTGLRLSQIWFPLMLLYWGVVLLLNGGNLLPQDIRVGASFALVLSLTQGLSESSWLFYWTLQASEMVKRRLLLQHALQRLQQQGFRYKRLRSLRGDTLFVQLEGRYRGYPTAIYAHAGWPPARWPGLYLEFAFAGHLTQAQRPKDRRLVWRQNRLLVFLPYRGQRLSAEQLRKELDRGVETLMAAGLQPRQPRGFRPKSATRLPQVVSTSAN